MKQLYLLAAYTAFLFCLSTSALWADEPVIDIPYAPDIIDTTEPSPVPAGDRYAKRCTPTPSLSRIGYPGSNFILPSNKLARPAGKAVFADGQKMYLQGRVFDSACVPLREAKVEIWHRDMHGVDILADNRDVATPYPIFAGAGRAITDNRGEFLFESIFPGAKGDETPYINIRVSHPQLGAPVSSTIYFADEPRNASDRVYQRLSQSVREQVTAEVVPFTNKEVKDGLLVHHDITLPTRDHFRGF